MRYGHFGGLFLSLIKCYNGYMHTTTIDFTEGNLKKEIILFAVPLFIGNLFQQFYSITDSIIVGNFLGQEALASVASSDPLTNLIIGFFTGLAIGGGVVIARAKGESNSDKLQQAIHTSVALALISGVFLSIISFILTPSILRFIDTPENIIDASIVYFRIYSAGLIFTLLYNILMGIMNAVGDSRHPLYYLMFSSFVNVVLDLVFIAIFHLGVGAASLATVISQALSVILSARRLIKTNEDYKLQIKKIRFYPKELKAIIYNGFPTGIQNSVINIANVVVQSNINAFGSVAVAASGAYTKLEGFAFLPITCFSLALTTSISQNLGAGNKERAKSAARFGIMLPAILSEIIGLSFMFFAPMLVALFNKDPEVIKMGVERMRMEALFFCFLTISHCTAGVLRGAGKAIVPMAVMLSVWCLFRVIYINVMIRLFQHIEVLYTAYPVTWIISTIAFMIYLKRSNWLEIEKAPDKL